MISLISGYHGFCQGEPGLAGVGIRKGFGGTMDSAGVSRGRKRAWGTIQFVPTRSTAEGVGGFFLFVLCAVFMLVGYAVFSTLLAPLGAGASRPLGSLREPYGVPYNPALTMSCLV